MVRVRVCVPPAWCFVAKHTPYFLCVGRPLCNPYYRSTSTGHAAHTCSIAVPASPTINHLGA